MNRIVVAFTGTTAIALVPLFWWMHSEISAIQFEPREPVEWTSSKYSAADFNAAGRLEVGICDPMTGRYVRTELTPPIRRGSPMIRREIGDPQVSFVLEHPACE